MGYEEFIVIVNVVSFITLLVIAMLLCMAARFKGEGSYAALLILFTALPNFIYNISDYFDWDYVALLMAPVSYAANLILMPFMLLLAHRTFNPYYRFRYARLLHFLPALLFAILVAVHIMMMPAEELENFSVERVAGFRTVLTGVNFSILTLQLIIYFFLIFSYLHKVKHYIFNNQSQADLSSKVWIPRFITFIGVLMVVAMVGSVFNPLGGFRLFYIINVLAMGYLLYSELQIVYALRNNRLPEPITVAETEEEAVMHTAHLNPQPQLVESSTPEEMQQLALLCEQAVEHLSHTQSYLRSNLTLAILAQEMNVSARLLSRAINLCRHQNFFEFINTMRIEHAKVLLLNLDTSDYNIESIYSECGFRSRSTFFSVFKKVVGDTPMAWLKVKNMKE